MNDLHHETENISLSTYADDTQIFYAGNDTVDVEQAINSDLRRVDNWFDKNLMQTGKGIPVNIKLFSLAIDILIQSLCVKTLLFLWKMTWTFSMLRLIVN